MASMTFAGAVDALYAVIVSVDAAAKVHKYRRAMGDNRVVTSILTDTNGKLNGGFISLESVPDGEKQMSTGLIATFRLKYEMFFGVDDANASEVTFRNKVEAVFLALNGGRIYAAGSGQTPALMSTLSYFMTDGGVLLHYAELRVDITGRVLPAS